MLSMLYSSIPARKLRLTLPFPRVFRAEPVDGAFYATQQIIIKVSPTCEDASKREADPLASSSAFRRSFVSSVRATMLISLSLFPRLQPCQS